MRKTGMLSILAVLVTAAPAQGAAFSGSCDVTPHFTSDPPIGVVPKPAHFKGSGRGTCTGRIGAKRLRNEPVVMDVAIDDLMGGCFSGLEQATGAYTFERLGLRLLFRMRNVVAHPVVYAGIHGGRGVGFVTAYTRQSQQRPDTLQRCFAGKVEDFHLQVAMLRTLRPFPLQPTNTFAGSCVVPGIARAAGTSSLLPVHQEYRFTGDGTCSGVLDGRRLVRAGAHIETVVDDRLQSCISGLSTARSILRIGDREISLESVHPGPAAVVRGEDGGLATATFSVVTELGSYPPDTAAECVEPTEVRDAPMRWVITTVTPLAG